MVPFLGLAWMWTSVKTPSVYGHTLIRAHLLGKFLLFQLGWQHVREGLPAFFVENVIHERRTFWQHFQTQWNTIHIIICNWFFGKRRLSQVENSGHQQHSFSIKGLRKSTKRMEEGYCIFTALKKCWLLINLKKGVYKSSCNISEQITQYFSTCYLKPSRMI